MTFIFTLHDINTDIIDLRYGLPVLERELPSNITKISEFVGNDYKSISFLDNAKKVRKCKISVIDFTSKSLTYSLPYNCFWDRHPLPEGSIPLGCPIRYVSCRVTKTYVSAISKDTYTINENVSNSIAKSDVVKERDDVTVQQTPYYETDGVFCSFDCMCAFLENNKNNIFYKDSEMLISKMYYDLFGEVLDNFNKASNWRTLSEYGGWLTIEKFRESFNKIEYTPHGRINNLPIYRPVGSSYEKMLKF